MNITIDDFTRLAAAIKEEEGLRLRAYRCPAGALTVGYGHNCDASPVNGVTRVGDRITYEEAEGIFHDDLHHAIIQVQSALPFVENLSPPRQAVLFDMAFNMGIGIPEKSGLLSFTNTLRLIEQGDYEKAAQGMLSSKWASQVKRRAEKLASQMETGEWQ